jgi:hypothetical protein
MAFLEALVQHFVVGPKSHEGKQKDKEWERLKADNAAMKFEVEGALLLTRSYKAEVEALKASAVAAAARYGADTDFAALQALVPQLKFKNQQQLAAILDAGAIQLGVFEAEMEELRAAAEGTAPVTERLTVAQAKVDRSATEGLNAAVVAAGLGEGVFTATAAATAAMEERLKSELEVAMKQSDAYKLEIDELKAAAVVAASSAAMVYATANSLRSELRDLEAQAAAEVDRLDAATVLTRAGEGTGAGSMATMAAKELVIRGMPSELESG